MAEMSARGHKRPIFDISATSASPESDQIVILKGLASLISRSF